MKIHCLVIFLLSTSFPSLCQNNGTISCLSVLKTDQIIDKLDSQTRILKEAEKGKKRSQIYKFYDLRKELIIDKIENGDFIECPDINTIIEQVIRELLIANPWLKPPKLVLLDSDITLNAYSLGDGTIGVHIGIFRKLSSVSELAFLLAHELAHYHLDQTNEMVRRNIRMKNTEAELYNQVKYGDINAIRALFYNHFSHTRTNELAADSLAFLMIHNSIYDLQACRIVLDKLDSAEFSEYPDHPDIKSHLHFSKFPFKDEWIRGRQSVLSNKRGSNFIFERDSIHTHPLAEERLVAYHQFSQVRNSHKPKVDETRFLEIRNQLDFLLIDLLKKDKRYDYAFYYALKFRDLYPYDESFKYEFLEILTDLYEVRNSHKFGLYVDLSAEVPWLKTYVNFLNNVTLSELGQIAYHYFQSNIEFDFQNEEQYHLLWKTALYANEQAVIKNITSTYLEKFPQGIYANHFLKQKNQE